MNNSDNNTNFSGAAPQPDQYADRVAAALPDFYCGTIHCLHVQRCVAERTNLFSVVFYFCSIDSIQLLEEGYTVVVTQARNERQNRQNDAAFSNWGDYPVVHYM